MSLLNLIASVWNTVVAAVNRLLEIFIIQPIVGLVDVAAGLVFTVPVMVNAGCQAVWEQIPKNSHGQVQMGVNLLQDGWARFRWPVMSVASLTLWSWVGVIPMLTGVLVPLVGWAVLSSPGYPRLWEPA